MLADRANDGRYPAVPFTFTVGDDPGEWRPTSGVNDPFAWVAKVDPSCSRAPTQVRTKGPNALKSGAYTKEYNEVKAYGGNGTTTPTLRTQEQTDTARFFAVNPVELFNRTFRGIAASQGLTLAEQARLFAMLNMAAADSLINCWDDKAFWSFWRPITAIHEGDNDGNPRHGRRSELDAVHHADAGAVTPPYPDHPSGYNCATGGFMYTAEAFFGRGKFDFSLTATVLGADP